MKSMKRSTVRRVVSIALGAMLTVGALVGCSQQSATDTGHKVYKVGVLQLTEHPALDASTKGFVEGLASQGIEEGKNLKLDLQNAQGDQSNMTTITHRFLAEKDDLIGVVATSAAQTVRNATKKTPIVGMAITDYVAAKLVASNEHPGGNVTGTTNRMPTEKQLELILKFFPTIKKIGVIYTSSEVNSQVQVKAFSQEAAKKGIATEVVTVTNVNEVQPAAEALAKTGVKAVFIPTDNVIASAFPTVFKVFDDAKIATFPSDIAAKKFGGLAMYSVDYHALGVEAGVMAAKILKGEANPADMPIEKSKKFTLFINTKVAHTLGIDVPEPLLREAEVSK